MKFIVHYEVVFEKYDDHAVKGSMTVNVGDEMSDPDGNVYKVKTEDEAMQYVQDFYYHNAEDDMIDLPKDFDGDTRLEIIEVIKK
tara:strand:+ start:267 stop:521 length:255 start_codon:yes stop_codon:yes gene_type:complete